MLRLAGLGLLKPQVHSTYSLDDAVKAFEVMEARQQFGKIVVTP